MDGRKNQSELILEHLKAGRKITPLDALSLYGCFRLGGRIYDLKKRGFKIEKEMVLTTGGAHVAEYRMTGNGQPLEASDQHRVSRARP